MARLPPDPMTGLDAATSGVAQEQPKDPVEGSLCAERIGEVGMIEDIEKLNPELRTKALAPLEVLSHRKVHVLESSVAEDVATHGAKSAELGRNEYRVARSVASESCECVAGQARRSSVERQGSGPARCVAWVSRIAASREERNADRCGLEVLCIAEKVPAIGKQFAGSADIGTRIHHAKGLRPVQAHDGV